MEIKKFFFMAALLPVMTTAYGQTISTLSAVSNLTSVQNSIYVTDPGKEGLFILSSATGQTADQATIIQDKAGKQYKRYITGPINAGWWLKDGASDNWDAMQKVLAFAPSGSEIIIPQGVYQFSKPILLGENKVLTIKSKGRLVFRNSDGFIIRGRQIVDIASIEGQPWADTPDYSTMNYSGITLEDAAYSEVSVNSANGFLNGIRLTATGTQTPNLKLGTQYNRITFNRLVQNKVGIFLTTGKVSDAPNIIDGDRPWVNENTITGGAIYGETGIVTTKGAYQIDPFNGNKFYNVGFEKLSFAANLNFAGNNMFIAPRFEANATFTVAEDCRANIIFTSEIYLDRLAGKGHETLIIGQILMHDGSQQGVMEATDMTGQLRTIVRNVPAL
ncbi:hypothetical protein [Rugamonas rivuli]|uniref:Pectate lyase superfamily protein domain-containing protein n=1 Tax=Rugamonas rivuli TaxID=2743358 RepID=A0A843SMG0_9BURK|nr:hypothetical protein [Rugamonas rivuli]MQA21977.1 hypothetical protein [Rugamonas rivuli]